MGTIANKGMRLGKCQVCLGVRNKPVQKFELEGTKIQGRKCGLGPD